MKHEHAIAFAIAGLTAGIAGLIAINTPAAPWLFGTAMSFGWCGLWIVGLTKR